MNGAPILVSGPTQSPVSLLDVKEHLRVTDSLQDSVLEALLGAAVAHFDGFSGVLGRAIMPQTWAQEWQDGEISLPLAMPNASSIVVKADGTSVSSENYEVKTGFAGTKIDLLNVSGDVIRVEYQCSMPAALLPTIRAAVLMQIEAWFERDDQMMPAVDALVSAVRWRQA